MVAEGGSPQGWHESRVTGDCHARFCERLGVKSPGATRRTRSSTLLRVRLSRMFFTADA